MGAGPLTAGRRQRAVDQAWMLLSAVRLRRSPVAGEEELDSERDWLLGEVNLLSGRPAEADEAFERVVRQYSSGRFGRAAQWGMARSAAAYERFERASAAYALVVNDLLGQPDDPLVDRGAVRDGLLALAEQLRQGQAGQWAGRERLEWSYRFLLLVEDLLGPGDSRPSVADVKEKQGYVLRRLAQEEKQAAATQPEQAGRLTADARRHLHEAADAFLGAARLSPGDEWRTGDDLERAAACYDEAGQIQQAIRVLRQFISDHPGDRRRVAEAVFDLGKAQQAAGQYGEAITQYLRMTTEFSASPSANKSLVPMAQCYKALGQWDEAEKILAALLDNDEIFTPDSLEFTEALFELAKLKYERRQYRQAIARFDEALQRQPNHRQALYSRYYLADSYRLSGLDLDGGIASAKTAPERGQLQATRAAWLNQARQLFDEVVSLFEARNGGGAEGRNGATGAAAPAEELDRLYLRNSCFFRADCMFDLGQYEEAIWLYDLAALKYAGQPEAVAAYVQIVNCYQRLGKPEQARTATERAKWLLKRLPAENFAHRPLPLGKEYFAQWLDWMSQAGTW